ncbi:hypothetical protein ACVFI8_10040 [Agarivorans sp. MS3-6]|uniref:hypothetical protein n=1 Tax=Agarivorans sp. TSD2052 TaxID=2937286 RepID=UPI00200C1302|nr:hypothetical protein [Agarivorans sp. TSD2052]UPW18516.1 hypothetical protein M0C34_20225 [Agarivorans sp. TSD2052]
MRKLLAALLGLALVLLLGILLLLALTLSKQATVYAPASVSAGQVAESKQWLKTNLAHYRSAQQVIEVQLNQQQMQGLLALASTALKGLNAEAEYQSQQLLISASLALPNSVFSAYINSQITVLSSADGLRLGDWQLGGLRLPGSFAQSLATGALAHLFPELKVAELLASVVSVKVNPQQLDVTLQPMANLGLRVASVYKNISQWQNPSSHHLPVDVYYQKLSTLKRQYGQRQAISLYDYLYPLSFDAAIRGKQGEVLAEQQALVWAMAIFFSQGAFQQLMVQRFDQPIILEAAPTNVTLAGRRDLLLHFVYSAGLSLAAERGFSASIGEFKELFDSLEGGSGFSFADLAADRTGIMFAETARNADKAQQFLSVMRHAHSEEAFFPRIDDLTEGISEQQFSQVYGSTSSELYQQKVFFIDQRIAHLAAFKSPKD